MQEKFKMLVQQTVESAGYRLERVSWRNRELSFYIDKDGGVGLPDCEKVTKLIEPVIEANDGELGENYHLSVSSVGIDGKDWE